MYSAKEAFKAIETLWKTKGLCAAHFMQLEWRWQRDVGTRTRQEGKTSSREWLVRSNDRDRSWRA